MSMPPEVNDVTPFTGLKLLAGPHREIVVEHVDDTQVYYAVHDDRSRSYFPDRYRVQISDWMRVVAEKIAAGEALIVPR